jgi:cycloeucalenol cycloisomerase
MSCILAALASTLAISSLTLSKKKGRVARGGTKTKTTGGGLRTKGQAQNLSKREGEATCVKLAFVWIGAVVVVIATQAYEQWGPWGYMFFCAPCALLYVTVPYLFPGPADKKLRWSDRYITKANLWIAIFSFIGNYWYTHYFYRVLKARYTFDAHRLNDVPICLYLMTHAYFMFYHSLSNFVIRFIRDSYEANKRRTFFECLVIGCMSYVTAFGEALTICAFPYYSFENRYQAYTLGSAFYGIYFLVSYPMFFELDEEAKPVTKGKKPKKQTNWSLPRAGANALAASMAVLCLLDFVRLFLGVELFAKY